MPDDFAGSRRYYYFIPAQGTPTKLVHRIENDVLDHLPGEKHIYLQWQQLETLLQNTVGGYWSSGHGVLASKRQSVCGSS